MALQLLCNRDVLQLPGYGRHCDVLLLFGNGLVVEYYCYLLTVAIIRNCKRLVTVAIVMYYFCLERSGDGILLLSTYGCYYKELQKTGNGCDCDV